MTTSNAGLTVAGTPTLVSGNTYRYALTGNAVTGMHTITVAAGWTDSAGNAGLGASAGINVAVPHAQIAPPANGSTITAAELTASGIQITFVTVPGRGLNVGSLNGKVSVSDAGLTVAGTPTLVSGNTYRYAVTGTAATGSLTISLATGWADSAGNIGPATSATVTVGDPALTARLVSPTVGGTIGAGGTDERRDRRRLLPGDRPDDQDLVARSARSPSTTPGLTVGMTPTLVSGHTYRYTVSGTPTATAFTITVAAGWMDSADASGTGTTATVNVAEPIARLDHADRACRPGRTDERWDHRQLHRQCRARP